MPADTPGISVLIASRNRVSRLQRVLESLETARTAAKSHVEVVVADNGSTDDTRAMLKQWCAGGPGRIRVFAGQPGKSRALNSAVAVARSPLLAFTDDDVEVPPNWIAAVQTFFSQYPQYGAAMGRVALPPSVKDPETIQRVLRYRGVVPLFDMGDSVCDVEDMYGANMAVRREVFEAIGAFDERLGPGASGLSEDIDLARRIRQAQMRIGYMPGAVVYHEVDPDRLTQTYYRQFQLRLGISGFEMNPNASCWRNIGCLVESAVGLLWWSLLGISARRQRAWNRMVRHADLVTWHVHSSWQKRYAALSR